MFTKIRSLLSCYSQTFSPFLTYISYKNLQNFDWKRHKPMCRTFQMRISRSTTSLQSGSSNNQEAMDTSNGPVKPTAIRPPLDQPMHEFLPKSTSTSSIHSFGAGSSSGESFIHWVFKGQKWLKNVL